MERARMPFFGRKAWWQLNRWEKFHLIGYDHIRQLEELELRGL